MLILLAALLVGATVAIHGLGTTFWIRVLRRWHPRWESRPTALFTWAVLSSTAAYLLALHLVEVAVWAVAYLALGDIEELATLEAAVYFSVVTFTSLGYGDITISNPQWRVLAGVEAMNGILLFGWSAALLFAVVQRLLIAVELREEAEESGDGGG